jgi:hypothetical protein
VRRVVERFVREIIMRHPIAEQQGTALIAES